MFAGCWQIMPVHSHLIRVERIGYWQLIRVEKWLFAGPVVYICRLPQVFMGRNNSLLRVNNPPLRKGYTPYRVSSQKMSKLVVHLLA